MLKQINYTYKSDKGTKSEETFHPNKKLLEFTKQNESRILLLKASNSQGKSFLMNLIALASKALELSNNELSSSLRTRIKDINSSENELNFHLELKETDGSSLNFIKDNNQNIITLNKYGESIELNSKEFIKEYKLLYDIPDKPLERIYNIVTETREKNENFYELLNKYSKFLNSVCDQLKDIKDQNKLNRLYQELTEKEEFIVKRKEELERITNRLNVLTSKRLLNELYEKSTKLVQRQNELEDLNKEYRPASNKTEEKLIDELNKIEKDYKQLQLKKNIINIITKLNEKYENQIDSIDMTLLNDINSFCNNIDKSFSTYEQEYFTKLSSKVKNFSETRLENLIWRDSQTIDSNKYEVLLKLKQNLKEINQDEDFKALFDNEFDFFQEKVNKISENLNGFETKTADYENFRKTLNVILDDIKKSSTLSKRFFNKTEKIKQSPKEAKKSARLKLKIEELEKEITRLGTYIKECKNNLEDLDIYRNQINTEEKRLDERNKYNRLSQVIKESEEELTLNKTKKQNSFDEMNKEIKNLYDKIEHEDKKEESLFLNNKREVMILNSKISQFLNWLKNNNKLIKSDASIEKEAISEEQKEFLKLLGKYVASRIGNKIIYQNKYHILNYVDYTTDSPAFMTTDDIRIKLSKFSGGQQSSNYLKSKLDKTDKRKYIVLFDESGLMDKASKANIIERLKEMEAENKLLIAIFAEKEDEPNKFEIETY